MRRLFALLLLLSFFCQTVATAGQNVASDHGAAFQAAHAEMHLERVAHHHDEHGATHQDNSPDSMRHMLTDAGSGTAALLAFAQLSLHLGGLPAPEANPESAGPQPDPDGLRRPPRWMS